MTRSCKTPECTKPYRSRGYCVVCYARALRHGVIRRRTVADRFWEKVDKGGDCWLWTGSRMGRGYGSFRHPDGRSVGAHRMAWELSRNRSQPPATEVCHHCDNPPCVRPSHLFLGSKSDNQRDSALKGRRGNQKLTVQQVEDIKRLVADGHMQRDLAREYGVSEGAISLAVNGHTFRALKRAEEIAGDAA